MQAEGKAFRALGACVGVVWRRGVVSLRQLSGVADLHSDFFAAAVAKWKIEKPSDWQKVTRAQFVALEGGRRVLDDYDSLYHALCAFHGQSHLFECRPRLGRAVWNDSSSKRAFLDAMAAKEGLTCPEDWARVTVQQIRAHGGASLVKMYNSVKELVTDVYPELRERLEAAPWKRPRAQAKASPHSSWETAEARRAFMDRVARECRVMQPSDWSRVTAHQLAALGGKGLLARYASVAELLQDVYPEQDMNVFTCRPQVPRNHWNQAEKRREFMDMVKERLSVHSSEDWQTVQLKDVLALGGGGLMRRYSSLSDALMDVYPEEAITTASITPASHWEDHENRRQFMVQLGEDLELSLPEDWAEVTRESIVKAGGGGLLRRFSSTYDLVKDSFPEIQEAVFSKKTGRLPRGFWQEEENVRAFAAQAREQLFIREEADWFRVSNAQLRSVRGGASILAHMSLQDVLRIAYPTVRWATLRQGQSGGSKKAAQRFLAVCTKSIFPGATLVSSNAV